MRRPVLRVAAAAAAFFTVFSVHAQNRAADERADAMPSMQERPMDKTETRRRGVVDVSVAHLRENPAYEAEMGTQELLGREVEITDEDGYWLRVVTPDGYRAWTNRMCIAEMTEAEMREYGAADKYICTAMYSSLMTEPSDASVPVSDLVRGDILLKSGGKVRHGYVMASTASGKIGWVKRKDVTALDRWESETKPDGESIVKEALRYVGIPYLWGGCSVKGFDCSGLVKTVFMMNGIPLPRNASQQGLIGEAVDIGPLVENGDCSALEKGDLLFFGNRESGRITHVGIYIGDSRMIHSSQLTRINSLRRSDPDVYENMDRLLSARRVSGQKD